MKIALVFLVGCLAVLAVSGAPDYTTKYDNVNLDDILNNERVLLNYFNCVMARGQCTPDGKELKETIPDALANECAKCNEKQKNGAEKVIRFLMKFKTGMWDELVAKYDPEGKYKDRYPEESKEKEDEGKSA